MDGQKTSISNPEDGESKNFSFDYSYWSHNPDDRRLPAPSRPCTCAAPRALPPAMHRAGCVTHPPHALTRPVRTGILRRRRPCSTTSASACSKMPGRCAPSALRPPRSRVPTPARRGCGRQGYNVSLFAYGQTGSGKSYSMVGYGADKGIIPLACAELFNRVAGTVEEGVQFKVRYAHRRLPPPLLLFSLPLTLLYSPPPTQRCAQRRLRGVSESRGSVRGSRKQRRGAEGGARGAGQVEASMMEIYNERVRDLFNPRHPANNTGLKVPANSTHTHTPSYSSPYHSPYCTSPLLLKQHTVILLTAWFAAWVFDRCRWSVLLSA